MTLTLTQPPQAQHTPRCGPQHSLPTATIPNRRWSRQARFSVRPAPSQAQALGPPNVAPRPVPWYLRPQCLGQGGHHDGLGEGVAAGPGQGEPELEALGRDLVRSVCRRRNPTPTPYTPDGLNFPKALPSAGIGSVRDFRGDGLFFRSDPHRLEIAIEWVEPLLGLWPLEKSRARAGNTKTQVPGARGTWGKDPAAPEVSPRNPATSFPFTVWPNGPPTGGKPQDTDFKYVLA